MSLLPPLVPIVIAVAALLLVGTVGIIAARSTDPVRHVRGRLRLALGGFGATLVASWVWGLGQPGLLGLPIVVGPGAAAAVGVLVFTLPPAHVPDRSGRRRVATLRARSATQVLGARALVPPAALLTALVAILVTTGVTADRTGDAVGRRFSVVTPEMSAGGSPYPGWYYGGPILITAAILVLAVAVAVRRTVLLPAVSSDDAIDDAWRAAVGRTLVAIATAGLLLYLAGVLWAAEVVWQILQQTGTTGLEPLAIAQGAVAQIAGLAAVVLLVLAAVRVAAIGRAAVREAGRCVRLEVDTASPVPPFEQVREQLAGAILSGALVAGERLPSIRQLAADLGLAAGTMARAYSELEGAGLVVTARGRGTRVAELAGADDSVQVAADAYVAAARREGLDLASTLALVRARYG